jgi:hypothetical protein
MQTARVTVLMTPDRKTALEQRAAKMGVSSGEYIRLAVDNFDESEPTEDELAALVGEVNRAIPEIRASLDRSSERLEAAHAEIDAFLRQVGIRK